MQGLIAMMLGIITYFWMVDFPKHCHRSIQFLTAEERALAVFRVNKDRQDVEAAPFTWKRLLSNASDVKVYGFACMFFLLNLVSTTLS